MIYATVFFALAVSAARLSQPPTVLPIFGQVTSQGCFDSVANHASEKQMIYASTGMCADFCQSKNQTVMILHANMCYCADTYPARSAKVDDDRCDSPCPGYSNEACGGKEAYGVYNLGVEVEVRHDDDSGSSSSTSTPSTASGSASASASVPAFNSGVSSSSNTTIATPTQSDSTPARTTGSPVQPTETSASAPRLSSPVGKFARMMQVLFN